MLRPQLLEGLDDLERGLAGRGPVADVADAEIAAPAGRLALAVDHRPVRAALDVEDELAGAGRGRPGRSRCDPATSTTRRGGRRRTGPSCPCRARPGRRSRRSPPACPPRCRRSAGAQRRSRRRGCRRRAPGPAGRGGGLPARRRWSCSARGHRNSRLRLLAIRRSIRISTDESRGMSDGVRSERQRAETSMSRRGGPVARRANSSMRAWCAIDSSSSPPRWPASNHSISTGWPRATRRST